MTALPLRARLLTVRADFGLCAGRGERRIEDMRTVLRAVAEPQAHRAESWRETVSTAFSGLEIDLDHAPDEHDQIVIGQVGPAQFIESRSGPGRARRTAHHIRSHDPDRYVLFVQADGSSVGEQLDAAPSTGAGTSVCWTCRHRCSAPTVRGAR